MPTYVYKAATSSGLIVRNRVEAGSKQNLIRILKNNDLIILWGWYEKIYFIFDFVIYVSGVSFGGNY